MSKPKGIIVIELPEVPEDCYHCNQIDGTYGYCEHVGKFVDHFVNPGERYPTCPIREMPEEDKKDYTPDELSSGVAIGCNACIEAFLDRNAGPKTKEAAIRIVGMKKLEDGDE